VRSLIDSNADGERGTWTLVLTDNGLVTYTESMLVRQTTAGRSTCESTQTYSKLVKLAKGLQSHIVRCIGRASASDGGHRQRRSSCARRELVRHGASQNVLPEFLDLVMHGGLKRVARNETQRGPTHFDEAHLARRCLHLDAKGHAIDGRGRLIVHRERTGESLAELDGAERGWERQERRRIGQVT
jgi:hypothetical protein